MRVAVLGAAGRMGQTVCAAVAADGDLELVAAVDPLPAEVVAGTGTGPLVSADLAAVADSGAEVAVDFTGRDAAMANLAWCAGHGVHAVVGTTGFSEDDMTELGRLFPAARTGRGPAAGPNCIVAPNFAIGAVLMTRLAELAAPWFETAEIVEMHHDAKADAPSGTALLTAARMAGASAQWAPDPTRRETLPGARGGPGPAGIRVHSLRLRGVVAHHQVVLGTAGQTLTIRHDSYDRSSFMPGVLLAVKAVAGRPGLTVGLDDLVGAAARPR
ncbi:MAG: 4-hydroxy-tetrahydrodipicolinate reductase [Acidimicrobiales bacterium]